MFNSYLNHTNSNGNGIGISTNPNSGQNLTSGQVFQPNYLTRMLNVNPNGSNPGGNNANATTGQSMNFNMRSSMYSNGGAETKKIMWERQNKTMGIHIYKQSSANEALLLCYQDGSVKYILKKDAGSTDIPNVQPCCSCEHLRKFLLDNPERKAQHPYYYKHKKGGGSELFYPVLDKSFQLGLILGIFKEEFDKVYLPQLELRNILSGNFELNLGMDSQISGTHKQEDYRKSGGNAKTNKRFNTKMINKFLMDNCPDFYERMKKREVSNQAQYLRKVIMRESEMVADLHGITRQQLIDLINYRSGGFTGHQEQEDNESRANSILRSVISRSDSRLTQFTDIMAFLGFAGGDSLDINRLVSNQAIDRSLEIVTSMKTIIQNSGLDELDCNLLKAELKNLIIQALNQ